MRPSVGDIKAIGMAPAGKSSGGCASEHKSGFSDIHSVNNSMSESGGVATSPPISLKYKSETDVMKFTANLQKNEQILYFAGLMGEKMHIYRGATMGSDFNWSQHDF